MTERREFKLSPEQLGRLLNASRPVMYLVANGVEPTSSQENADAVWAELGLELGFEWVTARPVPYKGGEYFTAVPTEPIAP